MTGKIRSFPTFGVVIMKRNIIDQFEAWERLDDRRVNLTRFPLFFEEKRDLVLVVLTRDGLGYGKW